MKDEDLFTSAIDTSQVEPLAARMRPRTIEEYIGQEHIIGKGRLLRRAIQADLLSSVIFYGPPGTGKTTLARVIANTTKSHFSTLNAVLSGVKELRWEIDAARDRLAHYGRKTILFVDEVHRWNKSQQDALLPWVENGTVVLIGATTENPYFEVNAALVSRSRVFQLRPLSEDDMAKVAAQALSDRERGYGKYKVTFEEGALEHLIKVADGDARSLLNALQLAVETTPDHYPPAEGEEIFVGMEAAEESIQKKVVLYDKEGDYHFDVISAFIKSLRGSDPDAALYWMARMVSAGEDPRFIFRRMLILACEDVGMADPNAISVVESCARAFDRIGMPEGRFHLTLAALYLATAPKSNSALGFFDALSDVEKEKREEVPNHLKDPSRDGNDLGHGKGYLYPHSYREHFVAQQYLPDGAAGRIYYRPSDMGREALVKEEVERKREAQMEVGAGSAWQENLTFSPEGKAEARWLARAASNGTKLLLETRDRLFDGLQIKRSDNILVLNASRGLLLWEAAKRAPEGLSLAQVSAAEDKAYIDNYKQNLEELRRPEVVQGSPEQVINGLEEGLLFEFVLGRNCLTRLSESEGTIEGIKSRLARGGVLRLAESAPSLGSGLAEFAAPGPLRDSLLQAEEKIFHDPGNSRTNWGPEDLGKALSKHFASVRTDTVTQTEERLLERSSLEAWARRSYCPALGLEGAEADKFAQALVSGLGGKVVQWRHAIVFAEASVEEPKAAPAEGSPEWAEVVRKTKRK